MGIKEEIIIQKSKSKNSNCAVTTKWKQAEKVILLTTENGGKSVMDEIPVGGVKKLVKQMQRNQPELNKSLSSTSSFSDAVSSSEISILSQSPSEENNSAQQDKSKKSRALSRSNTKASLFSNDSRNESPKTFELDIKGRLVILSKAHPFLEKISLERRKIPVSYRDTFRIDNLTNDELESLNTYLKKPIVLGR